MKARSERNREAARKKREAHLETQKKKQKKDEETTTTDAEKQLQTAFYAETLLLVSFLFDFWVY